METKSDQQENDKSKFVIIHWKKQIVLLNQVGFLGVKEHIILFIVADFALPNFVHFLSVLIYFHNLYSFVVGCFKREYDYRLIAFLFLSDNWM